MRIYILFAFFLVHFYVYCELIANFTISKTTACVGETITVTSSSTAGTSPIVNYIWSVQGADVESAEGSNLNSYSFTYTNIGTYNIGLIIQDQNGVASSEFKMDVLTIYDNPIANANSTVNSCTSPFNVSFNSDGSSSGASIVYSWVLTGGSPSTSNGSPITVNYSNPGTYTATLTVSNQQTTCKTIATNTVNVENFTADFTLPSSACSGHSFTFTDNSTSGTNQWVWSLSNGQSGSTSQNFVTSLNGSGNVEVTLVATNTNSACTDEVTKTIFVKPMPSPSFTFTPSLSCSPLVVNFINTSPNVSADTYLWNYGDGTSNYTGYNSPSHTYQNNNSIFFPNLTITASNGCVKTFVGDTILLFEPEAYFRFKSKDVNGCAPYTIQFENKSFEPSPIVSYFWDFGDGNTSNLQNPTHVYECGIFVPLLVITDNKGCVDSLYLNQNHYNLSPLATNIWSSNRPDTFLLQINGTSVLRIPTNFENYYHDVFGIDSTITNNDTSFYPIFDLRYGVPFSTDFTYEPAIQCANKQITFTSIEPDCPYEPGEVTFNYYFEGFDHLSPKTSTELVFPVDLFELDFIHRDTLRSNSLMDVGMDALFRGCLSPRTDKMDIIYLKAPVSKFNGNSFCNEGPGPHSVTIIDTASIYGHANHLTVFGEEIPSQSEDDVEVLYKWGDGTSTLITDDALLEDNDKGATTHIYPEGYGSYLITQIITNHTTGCLDSSQTSINISYIETSFVFDISGQNDSICFRTPLTFTETTNTSHSPSSFIFNSTFGIFSGNEPNSTFPDIPIDSIPPGEYNVILLATNSVGCASSYTNHLTVFALPIAEITLLEDSICKGTFTIFNPSTSQFGGFTNGWQEFRWNFSEGIPNEISTDINQSLSHSVNENLNITLQVVDGFGCISENPASVQVIGIKPEASFTTKSILCNNTLEDINGSASTGLGQLTYDWSLNSNFISSSSNPILQNTIIVSPPDTTKMEYTYQLIVTDDKGCKDTTSQLIMVSNPRVIDVDTTVSAKYVDVNGNFTCPPVVVDFNLSYISNWSISEFEWSFGNDFDTDIDSYNEDPSGIQYVRSGSYDYSVFLTESVTGCIFSRTESPFLLIGGPKADVKITADSTDDCGLRFLFEVTNQSENLDYWSWDLGDGTIVHSNNQQDGSFYHTYLDVNTYEPVITLVDDSSQCAVPISLNVESLGNGLNAYFSADPTEITIGFSTTLTDGSTAGNGQIVDWRWNFGDGSGDTLHSAESISHQYITDNSPTVILTVVDEFGCTDQYQLPLFIVVEAIFPNILTGINGPNSVWTLFADIFYDFELLIVNRWGNVIYEGKKDPSNPLYLWDGKDQKSGKPVNDGTYFYVIKGTLIDGRIIDFHDYITIVGH
ncbi:MAG: PKD domain-containing protein [Flavobacteriia bacterium]|nr:PKD domain-containing protein [Flavobacteriia bacterium]